MTLPRTARRRAGHPRAAAAPAALLLAPLALVITLASPAAATPTPTPTAGHSAAGPTTKPATFGIGPARDGRPDPYRPYFTYAVTSGVRFSDSVVVSNYSAAPLTLSVYTADAFNAANGDFALGEQGARPTGAGTWISVQTPDRTGVVTIPGRSKVVLPVRLRIPSTATPGDHVAGVIASLTTIGRNEKGAAVRLLQRIGARVFIRVSGPLHPRLSIERLSAHYVQNWNPVGGGSAVVTYRVRNTGNVILGATQQVSVRGIAGPTARATPPDVPLLLPGSEVDVRAVVGGLVPEISATATVRLTPLVRAGDSIPGLPTWQASTHLWAVPWVALAILVLVAGGGLWWWRRRRRPAGTPPPGATATGRPHSHRAARTSRGAPAPQRRGRVGAGRESPP